MGIFRIFNRGKEVRGDIEYNTREEAETEIRKAVRDSQNDDDFEPQSESDYDVEEFE